MEIVFNICDIERIAEGQEFRLELPVGWVRFHSVSYNFGKWELLIDYPAQKNVRCKLDSVSVDDETIVCCCSVENSLAKTILKLISKFIKLDTWGIAIEYPEIKMDISRLNLPIELHSIDCFPDEVKISGKLKGTWA